MTPGAGAPEERAWHALGAEDALAAMGSAREGLDEREAAERLSEWGRNAIPHRKSAGLWLIALRQLRSPIIWVLLGAAVVSVLIGHANDAWIIGLVVLVNTLIGTVQERQAERSARALQQLLRTRALVERGGVVHDVDAEEVVAGDVLLLEAGGRVAADARLIEAHGLEVDESLLTGESLAVTKDSRWVGDARTAVGDRKNMVFGATVLTHGRARAVVVATGTRTEIGRLAADVLTASAGKPPLLVRLERFTRVVGFSAVGAAAVVGAIGVATGYGAGEMFLFAVALAVSAIPEGLPVAITVALAVASKRMASRGVVVRRLDGVEGLGSCTLIASDKTGTLTCNALTVREAWVVEGVVFEVRGEGFAPVGEIVERGDERAGDGRLVGLAEIAALCNEGELARKGDGWAWRGDPTDVALLAFAGKAGVWRESLLERAAQVNEIPFEPERRYAATFHERAGGGTRVCVKGAPERVMGMCAGSEEERTAWRARAEEMAGRGLRVLAFAEGELDRALREEDTAQEPSGLRMAGMVGMIDPLRPGAAAAVLACAGAGIRVSMVTGDHPVTALAIARELGLAHGMEEVTTGAEMEGMGEEELASRVKGTRVFARVAPEQKLTIVKAAQRAGEFVAVTGDGVNDAPALRAANIGVAMGKEGTDVARESADLVLSDDQFPTIVAGVEEGRIAYDNIRKVVYLLVSTGAAEVVMVGMSVACGLPLPLQPAQILWLNLVTNGVQDVALAFEPGEGDVMRRRARSPGERVFDRLMLENVAAAALLMGLMGFGAFWMLLRMGWSEGEARNGLLLLMVLFENVHLGHCRSETTSAWKRSALKSPLLLGAAVLALLLHVCAMHTGVGQRVLGVAPVSPGAWAAFGGLAFVLFWLIEAHKWMWRRRAARA
ncbi:MAG: cation-translocating P-type ATPase [Phycisphaerales bacterium]